MCNPKVILYPKVARFIGTVVWKVIQVIFGRQKKVICYETIALSVFPQAQDMGATEIFTKMGEGLKTQGAGLVEKAKAVFECEWIERGPLCLA